jgi:four helix bundle protein
LYKFEKLEVWRLAIDYADLCYGIAERLPRHEEYNLVSQIRRAAVSIALNIAEGSTGQSDPEQSRFLGMAIRSVMETVACQHLIYRRRYLDDVTPLRETYRASERLIVKLQALRNAISSDSNIREEPALYEMNIETPFD